MLEVAAHQREGQDFIVLKFAAKQTLALFNILSSFNKFIPGYNKRVTYDLKFN